MLAILFFQIRSGFASSLIRCTVLFTPIFFLALFYSNKDAGHSGTVDPISACRALQMSVWSLSLYMLGLELDNERNYRTLPILIIAPRELINTLAIKATGCMLLAQLTLLPIISFSYFINGSFYLPKDPTGFLFGYILFNSGALLLGLIIGAVVVLSSYARRLINVMTYPMFLIAGLGSTTEIFPMAVRVVSYAIPLTLPGEIMRNSMDRLVDFHSILIAGSLIFIWSIPVVFLYRWIEIRACNDGKLEWH